MIWDELIEEIDRGRAGLNHGIPFGLPKLEGVIDGVTKETYTLILSNSGSGKTSFALYAYVYKPLVQHMDDDDFEVLYFSLEMNEKALYLKLLSIYIFETYGIQLTFKQIISREKEYVLSDEYYELIKECKPWVDKISKHLEIYDKAVNAETVDNVIEQRLRERGTFLETDTQISYTPNNPNLIYNVVIDHIGLVKPNRRTLKQEIDDVSSLLVSYREKCGISPVVIQQANREQGNIERFKAGKSAFTVNDAKDSGNTVQDCNVMLALYNPNRDGLKNYKHYNIEVLGNSFRSCMCLKNRYGDCDVEIGMNFFGGICTFHELPKPDEIYDYNRYSSPNYLLDSSVEQDLDNINIEDNNNSNLTFVL